MVRKLSTISTEMIIAFAIILFFAHFGNTANAVLAVREAIQLIQHTLEDIQLRANFDGLTWPSVWVSFRLIVMSCVFSLAFGGLLALLSMRIRLRVVRSGIELISAVLQALPEAMYVVIIFFVLVFLLNRGINVPGLFHDGLPRWQDTFAPSVALGMPGALYLRRLLLLRFEEEEHAQYIQTAVAKGASERRIFFRHTLPNLVPTFIHQIPIVASLVISNVLFAEFFLGYMGVLGHFTSFVGWSMESGAGGLPKPAGVLFYQPGAIFVVGLLLIITWTMFRVGGIIYAQAMGEWLRFPFTEGEISIGRTKLGILLGPLRSWLLHFTLEFGFSEFARVLSLMTILAMFHTYAVEQLINLGGAPPHFGIRSGGITWFSIIGDAANQVFSIVSHPFIIYAPCIALCLTMTGAAFIARAFRAAR